MQHRVIGTNNPALADNAASRQCLWQNKNGYFMRNVDAGGQYNAEL